MLNAAAAKEDKSVNDTIQIKEEPPDTQPIDQNRGKLLNPYTLQWTNLLYLGAGYIVSRSKPFQEGEYDEDIKSLSAKENGTWSHEEESMKLKRAKETCGPSLAQMKTKIKHPSSTNTCRSYSTHSESATKKNQPKRSSYEEVIKDTIWQLFNGRDGDIQSLIESFRPNQDEPSYKSNYFGFLTHQRKTENWIRDQIQFGLRVMNFTNRVNWNFPDLDTGALIEGFRPNQKELSYESNCSGILTQPGSSSNLIHSITDFGLKVIQLLNQRTLSLPYLEPSGFGRWQTRIWRPGDNINYLRAVRDVLSCTINHWFRRIQYFPFKHQDLPYLDSEGIKPQRLLSFSLGCVLETHLLNLDVPRHHTFSPKLSRLKHHHNLPHLADFLI